MPTARSGSADELYALRQELRAQQVTHRDPFGVFAALLGCRPEGAGSGTTVGPCLGLFRGPQPTPGTRILASSSRL